VSTLLSGTAVNWANIRLANAAPRAWVRQKPRSRGMNLGFCLSALGGIRTPNLLIRSQMLYPLSYERVPLGV
jgi:hypothetical protein